MKRWIIFCLAAGLGVSWQCEGVGTWVPLKHSAPGPAGHFLLMTDGSVIAENLSTNSGPGWFKLTPDNTGSYVNGTWSSITPMHDTRLDFSSDVLRDGRVLVAGGEYGSGIATSEVYDPVSNIWTTVAVPTNLMNPATRSPEVGENEGFYDAMSVLLANGEVLIAPDGGNAFGVTMLFNPTNNSWSAGPTTYERGFPDQAEATWVKLPDDSILTVDGEKQTSERYIPSLNAWSLDATVPVALYDLDNELGAAILLPNGNAIYFGGTGHTAIYEPTGNLNPGNWTAGPDFPNGTGQPDAPAAMMVNGKILCAVSATATSTNGYPAPTSYYEYDYLSNSFTQTSAPGGGTTLGGPVFENLMLDLPDGTVLLTHRGQDLYVYHPDGQPLAAGKPTITAVTTNADGSLHLTGTLFNGLSQGSSYGDDEQNDSNYPIVKFTDGNGLVHYGRSYNWSSTSVMTSNRVVTTECLPPATTTFQNTIQVIANGIASDGVVITLTSTNGGLQPNLVTSLADNGAGSLRQLVQTVLSGATITFATNLNGGTILLTSGAMGLAGNVTIDASALTNGIQINGNNTAPIFTVASDTTVVMNRLTLTNGYAGAGNWGGAISVSGTLTMNDCTLSSNRTDLGMSGGAIANYGNLTMNRCTLTGNNSGYGGAIENTATCVLVNCTFASNSAVVNSGGADNNMGAMTLEQCTISGNNAAAFGSGSGGGVFNYAGTMAIQNCIIAGNVSGSGMGFDIYNFETTITLGGTNIVEDLYEDNGGTTAGSGTILDVNPLLNVLGNYGGPTQTMPPLGGSPAIDGGNDVAASGLTTDQRGYLRKSGSHVDIGAVEVQVANKAFKVGEPKLANGSLQFAFTNIAGGSFTLLTSTNVALPVAQWKSVGTFLESPVGSGIFQLAGVITTNGGQNFYRVRSP